MRSCRSAALAVEPFEPRRLLDATVVFNEIMYHPADGNSAGEWLELHNQMSVDMDLSNWRLDGGMAFEFAEGTILAGGGYLVVAADPALLQATSGYADALGPFTGRLSNGGEQIELRDVNDRRVSTVDYDDRDPWPVGPDGGGVSLAKIAPNDASEGAENWIASEQLGGTPGSVNFVTEDVSWQTLIAPGDEAHVLAPIDDSLGTTWTEATFDDNTWTTGTTGVGYDVGDDPGGAVVYADEVLADQPVGYWRFEEVVGSTVEDDSGNERDGAISGNVTLGTPGVPGIGGNAGSFDGATGFVDLPGEWGGTAAVTVEAWVNNADPITGDFQVVVSSTGGAFVHFQLHSSGSTGPYTDGGARWVAPPLATPTDTWRHVVLVAESGNTRVYVNGDQQGAANTNPFNFVTADSDVHIGNGWQGGRWFKGRIDEVAIYHSALTEERIRAHYVAGGGNPLVAHWPFDVDATDVSPGGHHGTLGGGASIAPDAAVGSGALDLRDVPGFVDIPSTVLSGADSATMSYWINADSLTHGCCHAVFANDGWATGSLHVNHETATSRTAFGINGVAAWGRTDPILPGGDWAHVAFTYDAATGTTIPYVDGVAQTPVASTVGQGVGLGAATIGAWFNGTSLERFVDGRIDDMRIYAAALSAEQVGILAAGGEPFSGASYLPLIGADVEAALYETQTTAYVRVPFTVDDPAALDRLSLRMKYDDGFVAYLNGVEVDRRNAPAVLDHNAAATADRPDTEALAYETIDLTAHLAELHSGSNVLAIHGLNVDAADSDFLILPELTARLAAQRSTLAINEVGGAGDGVFAVELTNLTDSAISLSGFSLVGSGDATHQFTLPTQSLPAGGFLAFDETQLGFRPGDNDVLFLRNAGGGLIDAAAIEATARGRSPDGTGRWLATDVATPGAANHFDLHDEIVINEIMYHHRSLPAQDEVVEQATPIAVDGTWSYDDSGVDLGTSWRDAAFDDSAWSTGPALFHGGPTAAAYSVVVLGDSPAGYWQFEETGGATAVDVSGNGRDGTYVGGATPGAAGALATGGNAATFDGTSGYVQLPGTWGGADAVTVEAWVNTAAPITGDFQAVVSATDTAGFGHFQLHSAGLTGPYTDGGSRFVTPPLATPTDTWRHVVFVAESGNTRVYIDGVQQGAANTVPFSQVLPHGDVHIGNGHAGGRFFHGRIDEVAIYDHPLSEQEVVEHYEVGAGIVTALEGTPVSVGPTTHYFRNTFTFAGDPTATELTISPIVDDGAVYYLNGVEVHRQNMPAAAVTHNTFATASVEHPSFSAPITLPTDNLIDGINVLAVEVHQADDAEADVLFGAVLESTLTVVEALPFHEPDEEWIELFNRSAETVELTGWSLAGGIDFDFPPDTSLAAGQFLVVSNNAAALADKYPTIDIVGGFSRRLGNGGDEIVLRDPAGNPADEIRYYDGGRWPGDADGGGSTLELRDPDADNSQPEAWAASDEGSNSVWQSVSYRGVAQVDLGPTNFNELVLGMLDGGEVLLDDISVIESPDTPQARQLVQNGSFESDTVDGPAATWRTIGNHRASRVTTDPDDPANQVLHLVATGMADHLGNHAETTLKDGAAYVTINNGSEYEIAFRAKWLSGSSQLNSRLYFNRLPMTTVLDVPSLHGTPGAENSQYASNIGPTFDGLTHDPVVPDAGEAITVSVDAADPDGVASLTLWYAVNGGAWTTAPMTDQGDGQFAGTIAGQPAAAIVQFYVEGLDNLGASSTFPAAGPESRALVKVQDGQAQSAALHNFRIVMTAADADWLHANANLMSNDYLGATVIYDDSEVFYDAGVRLKGSTYGRPPDQFVSWIVRFQPDNAFRGVHTSVAVDRSARGPVGSPAVDELVIKQAINHAGGIVSVYDDIIRVIAPLSQHTSVAQLNMARYGDVYLDEQFDSGGDYPVHEFDGAYYLTATTDGNPESPKIVQAGPISYTDIRDLGDDKEAYRLNWMPDNHRDADAFDHIITLNKTFSLTGAQLDEQIEQVIDVDQWMRHYAMLSLTGVSDTYTHGNPHNLRVYQRPDGKIISLPHDMDTSFRRGTTASLWGNAGWNLVKIIERPQFKRLFLGHLDDLIDTTYNTTYMAYWTDHFGSLSGTSFASVLSYIGNRASYVTGQLPVVIPTVGFAVTTNGGADFTVDDTAVTLEGDGWIDVREIRLAGSDEPLDVTWTDENSWQVTLPVAFGDNVFALQAYDFQGNLIGGDTITVTSTVSERPVLDFLRITELNYHPHDPTLAELAVDPTLDQDQFEFLELQHTGPAGSTTIDLTGVMLTDGVTFDFTGSDVTTLAPGQFVLVARDSAALALRYGAGLPVAGEFFGGTGLRNSGETIQLVDADGAIVHDFAYDDQADLGWPKPADGDGPTLVVIRTDADYNLSESWYASPQIGGTPGAAATGAVIERMVFYANSAFDTTSNDDAIAADKSALLPGQTATAANYTSYDAGINGIMFDVAHATGALLIDDTDVLVWTGNGATPAWASATPPTISIRPDEGRGGSDRVVLTWPDGTIRNTWLRVDVQDDPLTTNLAAIDAFYFGNAVGETANDPTNALVTAADLIAIRDNPRGAANRAGIANVHDIDRDRLVDATDRLLARNHATGPFNALRLFTPPLPPL